MPDVISLIREMAIGQTVDASDELEEMLSDPDIFEDTNKSSSFLDEYREVREKLRELIGRWEFAQDQLESAKKSLGI